MCFRKELKNHLIIAEGDMKTVLQETLVINRIIKTIVLEETEI